ncbi:MAG: hypothetical protein ACYSWO_26840 [Planctomycetota bacterium]|jgi:hypothetical protein
MDEKQSTAVAQAAKRQRRDSIVIFLVLPAVCTLVLSFWGWLFYLHGRFSPYAGSRALVTILYAAMPVFIVWTLITRLIRLFDARAIATMKKKIVIGMEILISTVFIYLFIISSFTPIRLRPWQSDHTTFMRGFRDRVKSKADIGAIRDWLEILDIDNRMNPGFLRSGSGWSKMHWPDSIDWPESIKVFRPYFIQFPIDEDGNLKIRLCWGTGMTRTWGVEIGPEEMEIPASDLRQHGEIRLPLQRGAYIWHEMR